MKVVCFTAAVFVLALASLAFGQGHSGHGASNPMPPDPPAKPPVVTRRFADVVTEVEKDMDKLKEATAAPDDGSFVQTVDIYVAALGELREAMRNRPGDTTQFAKDLAAAEKTLRLHMVDFRSLIESAATSRKKKFEEVGLAAGQTLDATLIWKDSIKPRKPSDRPRN